MNCQSTSELLICGESYDFLITVNAGFDGGPETINTISTSITCMYLNDQIINIDCFMIQVKISVKMLS